MRVLTLTADYPPQPWSGIGTAVGYQCQALAQHGVEVHALVPVAAKARETRGNGVTVHRLRRERCQVNPARFDLIHLHSLALTELALELARRYHLPLVYTAHSLLWEELAEGPEAADWIAVQELVLRCSDGVVFLTEDDQAAALERLNGLGGQSTVIPNGTSPRRRRRGPRDPREIVFAGRFTRQKGTLLVEALARELLATNPVRFVFAGGHGDEMGSRAIDRLVSDFPQACRHLGWLGQAELETVLAGAGLVLVPSEYEPFGMVALEAMQLGTPVLARAVGGLRQVVALGSGGMTVPSDRPDDWYHAALNLMEDQALRERLGEQGPAWVAAHFDAGPLAARLLAELYQPLVSGQAGLSAARIGWQPAQAAYAAAGVNAGGNSG